MQDETCRAVLFLRCSAANLIFMFFDLISQPKSDDSCLFALRLANPQWLVKDTSSRNRLISYDLSVILNLFFERNPFESATIHFKATEKYFLAVKSKQNLLNSLSVSEGNPGK